MAKIIEEAKVLGEIDAGDGRMVPHIRCRSETTITNTGNNKRGFVIDLHSLFITPIFSLNLAGYEDLVKDIKDLQDKEPQTIEGKSTKGGWHSHDFLHENEKFGKLKSEIVNLSQEAMTHLDIIKEMIPEVTGMWAVVNGPGSSNRLHNHPFNYLSGVFYLQVPKDSGSLIFHDPRPQSEVLSPPKKPQESIHTAHRVTWTPKQNDILFFPSWLQHEVKENNSQEERIVISFNIELKRRNND